MKVYVYRNGFTMSGKAWEIRQKLREYSKEYVLVKDWTEAVSKSLPRPD
ncbi:Z-ring formation inhibitor MciZ [Mesobacillus campisalis]|nr:Z-ring formation inhibitor MciZ [Mesobacillus campisalis]